MLGRRASPNPAPSVSGHWGRGGEHGQQYDKRGDARAMNTCAVRVAPSPLTAHAEPSREFVGSGSPEPLLMNTEGLRRLCEGRPSMSGAHAPVPPRVMGGALRALRYGFWGGRFGV